MKIIIGCEESQAVCIEFRKRGHEAYSCDLEPCSGGHPEWHLQEDVLKVIEREHWDMMIAFPPCTHLAVSGAAHFEKKRADGRQQEGIDFFLALTKTNIPKWAIENPVGIMSNIYRKPDQIIQPYYFGDKSKKTTCLWLNNLPKLLHNDKPNLFEQEITHVKPKLITYKNGKTFSADYSILWPSPDRAKLRSKTYPGIAKAIADTWGLIT